MAAYAVRLSDEYLMKRLDSSLCIRCSDKPRHVNASGNLNRLCKDCMSELSIVRYAWKERREVVHWLCVLCHVNLPKRTDSGQMSMYCSECARLAQTHSLESAQKDRKGGIALHEYDDKITLEVKPAQTITLDDRRFAVISQMIKLIDLVRECVVAGDRMEIDIVLRADNARISMGVDG